MSAPISISDIAIRLTGSEATFHRESVADLLHRSNRNFPGAQPVSFARHHLHELQQRDYFMCEKTDGVRCLLYLAEMVAPETGERFEMQFLIDRKNDYYAVAQGSLHIPVPGEGGMGLYHMGTLLDGELVRQKFKDGRPERLAYLIFDCLTMDGENVCNRTFDKRLARIVENIANPIKEFGRRYPQDIANQPFQLEMKKMEFPYGMEMMFKDKIPHLPHGNDGLIFTCKETPYVAGTDQHILKWKPPSENTIDFRLLLGNFAMLVDDQGEYEDWDAKPEMELHVNHGNGNYQFYAPMSCTEAEWAALKNLNQRIDGRIIECYRDPVKGMWRPKVDDGVPRFRDDKTDGNHVSVVESVLTSIEDAVTEQDLIQAAQGIRTAFKARQQARSEEAKRVAEGEKRRAEEERRRREEVPVKEEGGGGGPRYED